MERVELLQAKAAATTTDRGEFVALVAVFDNIDRQQDTISPVAFSKSISEWRTVGRRLPLHWNHVAEQIIGDIDPQAMSETKSGLEVSGRIDLDDELGRKVWKSLRANRLGFSFGFAVTKSHKRLVSRRGWGRGRGPAASRPAQEGWCG